MYGISGVECVVLCCLARFEDKACKIARSREKIVNGRRCILRSETCEKWTKKNLKKIYRDDVFADTI
jgi:hypothetical protein